MRPNNSRVITIYKDNNRLGKRKMKLLNERKMGTFIRIIKYLYSVEGYRDYKNGIVSFDELNVRSKKQLVIVE